MATRGGGGRGQGRKPSKGAGLQIQKSVALEVLSRIEELGIPKVKTEADYCLHLMKTEKARAPVLFVDMLNRAHGKPAQAVIAEGKLTIEVIEVPGADSSAAEADPASKIM